MEIKDVWGYLIPPLYLNLISFYPLLKDTMLNVTLHYGPKDLLCWIHVKREVLTNIRLIACTNLKNGEILKLSSTRSYQVFGNRDHVWDFSIYLVPNIIPNNIRYSNLFMTEMNIIPQKGIKANAKLIILT